MASQQHHAIFREEDIDDDESQEDEEYEEDDDVLADDEDNHLSPSTALAVTVAVPGSSVSNGVSAPISTQATTTIVVADSSDPPKKRRVEQTEEKKPAPPLDDSRRLFQRLWTDEDEIELLQGFLDYTSQRGSSHHNDTAFFYDQIKSKLQLDFNKNQLMEKIRRLKKKYRNVLNKIGSGKEFSFKSAHDQATFEISRKIWTNVAPIGDNSLDDDEINPSLNPNSNLNFSPVIHKNEMAFRNSAEKKTPKRSRPRSAVKIESIDGSASNRDHNCISNAPPSATATATNTTAAATIITTTTNNNNNCNSGYSNNIPSLIEETVRSCLSRVLKELMGGGAYGGRGFSTNLNYPVALSIGGGEMVDEKWRKQHILELEVFSKRLELVQDQIKAAMEELRSHGRGGG